MEKSTIHESSNEEAVKDAIDDQLEELTKKLKREKHYDGQYLYHYNNTFWCPSRIFKSMLSFQNHFEAKDTDIILATAEKSGTTWLKALTFTIINRTKYSPNFIQNPLLTNNPHELVPNFEFDLYFKDQNPNLDSISSPRILSTHVPYSNLPISILNSKCRIVHICRNPLDQFVSYWHFVLGIFKKKHIHNDTIEMPCIDEAFEFFCQGVHSFGPFWDHAIGYWRASIESPERVLFLKYEDLKDDINTHVKKIAEFLGFGFSIEEEKLGLIEEISKLCSFENLKNLQVNKDGQLSPLVMNSSFFRKGNVGDWINFISPSQAQRLENITKDKFGGSGIKFKSHAQFAM